jgi:hypothetical protein
MSTPAADAYRAELMAEKTALVPQLKGLMKMAVIPQDDINTLPEVTARTDAVQRRIDLIDATLAAMDELEADGYPGIPPTEVSEVIYTDLESDIEHMTDALTGFIVEAPVTPAAMRSGRSGDFVST